MWWDSIVAAHQFNARAQIGALFDALASPASNGDSWGCALAIASVELAGNEHPAIQVAVRHTAEMRRRFHDLAVRAGASKSREFGEALMLLLQGGYVTSQSFI
jgi:hypothetical protein